jgi:hypothetical protein
MQTKSTPKWYFWLIWWIDIFTQGLPGRLPPTLLVRMQIAVTVLKAIRQQLEKWHFCSPLGLAMSFRHLLRCQAFRSVNVQSCYCFTVWDREALGTWDPPVIQPVWPKPEWIPGSTSKGKPIWKLFSFWYFFSVQYREWSVIICFPF